MPIVSPPTIGQPARRANATLYVSLPDAKEGKVVRGVVALQQPYRRVLYRHFDQRLGRSDESENLAFTTVTQSLLAGVPGQAKVNLVIQAASPVESKRLRQLCETVRPATLLSSGAPQTTTDVLQRVAQHGRRAAVLNDLSHEAHLYLTVLSDGSVSYVSMIQARPWRVTFAERQFPTGDPAAASFMALKENLSDFEPMSQIAVVTNNDLLNRIITSQAKGEDLSKEARGAAVEATRVSREQQIKVHRYGKPDDALIALGRLLVAREVQRERQLLS